MKKTILMLAVMCMIFFAAHAQDASTQQFAASIAKLDKAISVKDYQQLANAFQNIADAQKTKWLPYYYAAFCHAKISWLKTDDPDNIEQYAGKADELINKAKTLLDSATQQKEMSEIYCVLGMVKRAYVFINPMTYGREYGMASAKYVQLALEANANNPRALYLAGWEKAETPKMYGGDKSKAKELLTAAKQKLDSEPSTGPEPHWGKTEVNALLAKLK